MQSLRQTRKILITGASDGIGKVTARELAAQGHDVVIVGRNPAKTAAVAAEIGHFAKSGKVDWLTADLARPAQVRELAAKFTERHGRLDVLVNNAGAFFAKFEKTPDGIEQTFALNHLSYFFLSELLLQLLVKSNAGRIVNVASEAHRGCSIDFDDIYGERKFNGWRSYQRSKLANILFTRELARRLRGTRVTANALHPGFVASKFGHNNAGWWKSAIQLSQAIFAINEDRGARTSVFLASDASVANISGAYFDKCKERQPSSQALDDEASQRLWQLSEDMLACYK